METLSRQKFEEVVKDGLREIPERFLKLLDNVALTIADEPTAAQRRKMRLRRSETLLGLYEGIPRTRRGGSYFGVLPDKITVFRMPILAAARDEIEARRIVRDTVWHEIAHHFGMEEERVRRAERTRRK